MSTVDYAQLYAAAIAESGLGSEVVPDGQYDLKIGAVKPGNSKSSGKFQVGIRLDIQTGPYANKSTWVNQTLTPENPKAVAAFLRVLKMLGVPQDAITAGLPPAKLVDYIAVGTLGTGELGHHTFGTNDDGTPKAYQDLKKFNITGMAEAPVAAGAAAPLAAAPLAAAPAVPQAPAPVAPAPAVAPVEVAAPVQPTVVAPAPVTPVPVVPQAPAPGQPPF